MKKAGVCLIILSMVLCMVLLACGGRTQGAAGTGGTEKTVYYAYNSEPVLDWDPSVEFSNGIIVMHNIYETLLRYWPEEDRFDPILATSYDKSADSLTWTFKIRQGVKFHDGTPLNAEAVKFSFDRTIELGMGAAFIWDPVEVINVLDEYTVEFKLKYTAPLDLILAAGYAAFVFSPSAVKSHPDDWLSQGNTAGTGPYTVRSFKMGEEVILQAFEDYWGGWNGNHAKAVYIRRVSENASRRQLIEKGEATFIYSLTPEDHAALRTNPDITVTQSKSFQNMILFINSKKAPLDNPLVRQALSYAVPYSDIIQYVIGGEGAQGRGVIPDGLWGHGDDVFQYNYDLDKAKALLAQAGYPSGGLNLLVTYSSGDEGERRSLELYKSELDKIGVNLEIRSMLWDNQWDTAKSDPTTSAQDILAMYWWPDYASPYSWLLNLYHTEAETMFNFCYYSNPQFDNLIDEGNIISGIDRDEGERLFIEAQKLLLNEAVTIPMYDIQYVRIYRNNFKGYKDNPAYPNVVFFYDTWIE
jgi:peptide/nickel transport system substrate-binding protein